METLNRIEVDCSTGESKVIPLTAEEIAQVEANRVQYEQEVAARQAEAQAKAEAKASALAKLAALGLTQDEANAIAGA